LLFLFLKEIKTKNTRGAQYFDANGFEKACLAVRVQNLTANAKSIYDVGPSSIAFAFSDTGGLSFKPIGASSTLLSLHSNPLFRGFL